MRNLLILAVLFVFSCNTNKKNTTTSDAEVLAYASFGNKIDDTNIASSTDIATTYKSLKVGDTIATKLKGNIKEVCSKKGCWMTLDIGNDKTVMVKFKDYGFFMPLNAEGEAIIHGKAFVTQTSVDELRHYAEDAGKSEQDIAAITKPKFEYRFEADGVLLKK